jgi:hypothetical protein
MLVGTGRDVRLRIIAIDGAASINRAMNNILRPRKGRPYNDDEITRVCSAAPTARSGSSASGSLLLNFFPAALT